MENFEEQKKKDAALQIKNLQDAHGRRVIKLSEIEAKIMRFDGKILLALERGGETAYARGVVFRLCDKRLAILADLVEIVKELKKLGFEEPPWGRQPAAGQISFVLD